MKDEEEKISRALNDSKYLWRTVDGLSRDAKLSTDRVLRFIDSHSDAIVRARQPNEKGQQLYALRMRVSAEEGLGRRIVTTILNRSS